MCERERRAVACIIQVNARAIKNLKTCLLQHTHKNQYTDDDTVCKMQLDSKKTPDGLPLHNLSNREKKRRSCSMIMRKRILSDFLPWQNPVLNFTILQQQH